MNTRAILTIMRKDLRVVVQSRAVMLPIILVPTIFVVVMPLLVALAPQVAPIAVQDIDEFREVMPDALRNELSGLEEDQQFTVLTLKFMLAPLFVMIPLLVANVIAADSFVGERERKTLEALIYTPTTDTELYLAKVLVAWVPAMLVTLFGFTVYTVISNLAAYPVMQTVFFPNTTWLLLVLWVSPAAAGLGLSAMVFVSSNVSTFQEAMQLGGLVVLPIVFLFIGQATGAIYFSVWLVLLLGLVLWLVTGALLSYGIRIFDRNELIARL